MLKDSVQEGDLLWEPSEEFKRQTHMTDFINYLKETANLDFTSYNELWDWSFNNLEDFWGSVWNYFDIKTSSPYSAVLSEKKMPGTAWFKGAKLNFAEHVFRNFTEKQPALMFQSELEPLHEISWQEIKQKVSSLANALRKMGVKSGDRVVAYIPNIPEAIIAVLACSSLGAIWSSCSPDFGSRSVIDRFKQIEPKVLFAVDGYKYSGKNFDRRSVIDKLQKALPTLEQTIFIKYLSKKAKNETKEVDPPNTIPWETLINNPSTLSFEQVPFDHPLWVVYSSGTTGLPKPIVQGHGGIIIELLKFTRFHLDLKVEDRFFWFSTTGWIMWNILLGGLLAGSTVVLYDGNPGYPDINVLWKMAQDAKLNVFGSGAPFYTGCMKAGLKPGNDFDLTALKTIGSTGSPLPPDAFLWAYQGIKKDLWLASISGGTDVCTGFLGGSPLLPVHAGELQCSCLGVKAQSFDENGNSLINEVGELVITEPMPSMPLYFWNDKDNQRYFESYFDMYPDIWRHGDWIKINDRGACIITGRSDSTLKRMGVRMGSSEIYSAIEDLPEVIDSLIIGYDSPGGKYFMPLFVALQDGLELDEKIETIIKNKIIAALSSRHLPDAIYAIKEVPRTLSGKKLEVPIKKILMGFPIEKSINPDTMANPDSINYFIEYAAKMKVHRT